MPWFNSIVFPFGFLTLWNFKSHFKTVHKNILIKTCFFLVAGRHENLLGVR